VSGIVRVLIVDDIEDNRLVLKGICRKIEGIEILEAENGEEAVKTVTQNDIDIVLMDVMMPVMDGFEATKIIKNMEMPPYILIVTAVSDSETQNRFAALGVDGYLKKPVDREAMRARIETLKQACLVKRGVKVATSAKKPLSKQASWCRNFKTYFYVENEEDAMNLGLWLTEYKARHESTASFEFEDSLAAVYKICNTCIGHKSPLTVVIEEDFENLYISAIPSNTMECMEIGDRLPQEIKNRLLCESTVIYLTIAVCEESQKESLPVILPPKEKISVSEKDQEILRKSHKEKISAEEFMSDYLIDGSIDEIHDLRDIEDRWKDLLTGYISSKAKISLDELADEAIFEYARVVNRIYEFSAIGYALSSLVAAVKSMDEARATEVAPKLGMLLEHILDDLVDWRKTVFITKETADIHYLDSSLLSSCMQIDAIISQKVAESSDSDEDLELF